MTTPKIALGTWSWGAGFAGGDQVFGNHLDPQSLHTVFDAAMAAGLTLWDTAAVYGMGSSETLLGARLRAYPRDRYLLSTKFTPQLAGGGDNPVADMLHQSLERLGTDYVDYYWVHNPTAVNTWTEYFVPLLKSGKVKHIGVSNHNLQDIQRVNETLAKHGLRLSAVQNHYSLLYRSSEKAGILDYCRDNDITFFAYMVLEQGALTGRYTTATPMPAGSGRGDRYNPILPQLAPLITALRQIGQGHAASVAQVAIAWAIAKHTLPIIGVTKASHVEDAAKASQLQLTPEEMARLEALAVSANLDTRGGWEQPMD